MAFPTDPLGARVELDLGGVWTDVTPHVQYTQPIRVVRGRRDEAARTDPTSCAVLLRDPDGRYAPRNPHSPYYGLIGRNTPMRVSVAAGTPWLGVAAGPEALYASTPDADALHITGDLDIRCDVQVGSWDSDIDVTLAERWTAGSLSYQMYVYEGAVTLQWSPDGTTENVAAMSWLGEVLTPRIVLRATLDVDNGDGNSTARFYYGPTMDGPWTQIGEDWVSVGTTQVYAGTSPLSIAPRGSAVDARIYGVQVRDGINGTLVACPDFTAQAPGAPAFTDTAGREWTVKAGALTNRATRAVVEVPAWPWRWGRAGRMVTAQLAGAGILRRLRKGASPLDSTLRRRIPADPSVVAYWPMEDGQYATAAYSPIPGVAPMTVKGLTFSADDSLPGSAALPSVGADARLSGAVPRRSTGEWCLEFVYKVATAPSGDANAEFLRFTTTGGLTWRVGVGASGMHLTVTDSDGTSLVSEYIVETDFFGSWSRFYVEAQQSGSTVSITYAWVTIGGGGFSWAASFTGSVGAITSVRTSFADALAGMVLGHIAVFDTFEPQAFNGADTGFAGESTTDRYRRLTGEEGIPATFPYGREGTAAVGPQRPGAVLDLLQDAADADVGILGEAWDALALAYRPRVTLYNQTPALVLDYAAAQVAAPLAPLDDDQATQNDITVSRPSGSSARAVADTGPLSVQAPPGGVGRYTTSLTRNVNTDAQLPDLAGWLLHLGTWDGVRYPQVTINLHESPELVTAARDLRVGDRIRIVNLPVWLPPGGADLLVQAIAETIGIRTWVMTLTCTPAGPWDVGVIGASAKPRANTSGCVLGADVGADDTTLSLTTTDGPRWADSATYPDDFPFDLLIADGERVTCTAITGTGTTQSATVTRAVNGVSRAWDAGATVSLADRTYTAL